MIRRLVWWLVRLLWWRVYRDDARFWCEAEAELAAARTRAKREWERRENRL